MIVAGASFHYTNSSCQKMPDNQQHTMWYSLPKGSWVPWDKHPSWASIFVHPCAHGLNQTTDPTWCKLFHHGFVPGLQHIPHLPKVIPEGWWMTCCNGKCLQDHFESFAEHEHTQSHWCSDKTINLTKRPTLRVLWAIDGSHEEP